MTAEQLEKLHAWRREALAQNHCLNEWQIAISCLLERDNKRENELTDICLISARNADRATLAEDELRQLRLDNARLHDAIQDSIDKIESESCSHYEPCGDYEWCYARKQHAALGP